MPRVRAVESWAEYFRSFELTLAMIEKLEAFTRGDESQESLQIWARARWTEYYPHGGPTRSNSTATRILGSLYDADEREDWQTRFGEPALRNEMRSSTCVICEEETRGFRCLGHAAWETSRDCPPNGPNAWG